MRGPPVSPTPQGSMLVGASSSHKPALLCVCLLGLRGILLCAFVSLFVVVVVWPLASPQAWDVEGR